MDIFVYFSLSEEIYLGELEDTIDDLLGDNGEVTGSGIGINGGNIDIEIYDKTVLDILIEELRKQNLPSDTYLVIDGNRKDLY